MKYASWVLTSFKAFSANDRVTIYGEADLGDGSGASTSGVFDLYFFGLVHIESVFLREIIG